MCSLLLFYRNRHENNLCYLRTIFTTNSTARYLQRPYFQIQHMVHTRNQTPNRRAPQSAISVAGNDGRTVRRRNLFPLVVAIFNLISNQLHRDTLNDSTDFNYFVLCQNAVPSAHKLSSLSENARVLNFQLTKSRGQPFYFTFQVYTYFIMLTVV